MTSRPESGDVSVAEEVNEMTAAVGNTYDLELGRSLQCSIPILSWSAKEWDLSYVLSFVLAKPVLTHQPEQTFLGKLGIHFSLGLDKGEENFGIEFYN